jgi:hypothetical protein
MSFKFLLILRPNYSGVRHLPFADNLSLVLVRQPDAPHTLSNAKEVLGYSFY